MNTIPSLELGVTRMCVRRSVDHSETSEMRLRAMTLSLDCENKPLSHLAGL